MTATGGPDAWTRDDQGPQRAGFVELLFDVVFVFAFHRLSNHFIAHLTWRGFYEALVLLLAMWWVWFRMAWTTNRYDPTRPVIQLMVIITMLGTLLMAAALPEAFHERGLAFATVYVAVQVLRPLWLVLLGGERRAQLGSVHILFWAGISAVPWIAGTFAHGATRLLWWTVAVGLDYTGGMLDFPTPGLGRAGLRGQAVAGEHLTERYRQLLIIAFGEAILISGIEFSPYAFERDRTAALVVSFAITVLLWQIYFHYAGRLLPAAIAASHAPAQIGELAAYAHLVMVTGVGLTAVGDQLVMRHPAGHTQLAWILVILGGPALFLVGRAILDFATFSRVSWPKPIGLLLLAALAPVAVLLPPVIVAGTAGMVLAGIAVSNAVAWRMFPRHPIPPGRTVDCTAVADHPPGTGHSRER